MEVNFVLDLKSSREVLEKKCYFPLFLIFTDVNSTRFNFVNADKPCRKKTKSSGKALTVFDKLIVAGSNLMITKLLTNVNLVNF